MKINRITQLFGIDLQKTAGNAKAAEKTDKTAKGDKVSFSKQGKDLQAQSGAAAAAVLARVESLPDMRPEKVAEAKEKIAAGYFDTPEFMERLADRLMKEFGFRENA